MRSADLLPRSRTDNLVIRELDDETLVYDTERSEAHCLNQTAALVWKQCDGKTTAAQAAQFLQSSLNMVVDADLIWLAVKQLERFDLVEMTRKSPRVSRRKLLFSMRPLHWPCPRSSRSRRRRRRSQHHVLHQTQSRVAPARAMAIAHLLIATRELAVRLSR
jgi:hypothetical protein